jgi:hypothetical protein
MRPLEGSSLLGYFFFTLAHLFLCAVAILTRPSALILRFRVGRSCSMGGNPRFNGGV